MTAAHVVSDTVTNSYTTLMDSTRDVARSWNAQGFVGPQKGTPWSGTTVGRTLRGPRLAGLVTYRGELVRDEAGQAVRAEWPPVVPVETWEAAQVLFADPKRKYNRDYVSPYLLSGIALCDVCGATINSGGTRKTARGMVARLRCSRKGGHVYREADLVEEYVEDQLLQHLAEADPERFTKPTETPDLAGLRRELAELDVRAETLALLVADGTMAATAYRAAQARLEEHRAQVEARVPSSAPVGAVLGGLVTARDLGRYWHGLSLDQRREVLRATVEVRVKPPRTKEGARMWLPAEWDEDGAQVRQAGWYCNPDSVSLRWLL